MLPIFPGEGEHHKLIFRQVESEMPLRHSVNMENVDAHA